MQSRRNFTKTMLAAIPAAACAGSNASQFGGVQIGAISYSLRTLPIDQILPGLVKAGVFHDGKVGLLGQSDQTGCGEHSHAARTQRHRGVGLGHLQRDARRQP